MGVDLEGLRPLSLPLLPPVLCELSGSARFSSASRCTNPEAMEQRDCGLKIEPKQIFLDLSYFLRYLPQQRKMISTEEEKANRKQTTKRNVATLQKVNKHLLKQMLT